LTNTEVIKIDELIKRKKLDGRLHVMLALAADIFSCLENIVLVKTMWRKVCVVLNFRKCFFLKSAKQIIGVTSWPIAQTVTSDYPCNIQKSELMPMRRATVSV